MFDTREAGPVNRPMLQPAEAALADACAGFFKVDVALLGARAIRPEQIPPPAHCLLVHDNHMTTVLQDFYGRPVTLHVQQEIQVAGDRYSRQIQLRLPNSGRVVEFGVVHVDLSWLPGEVISEILSHQRPLGEILIRHDVLRAVEPLHFYQFGAESPFLQQFSPELGTAYGRVARIRCNGAAAIRLLEVVRSDGSETL